MDPFTVWAIMEFALVVIVIIISIWRASVVLKDIAVKSTEKVADWIGRRRSGL